MVREQKVEHNKKSEEENGIPSFNFKQSILIILSLSLIFFIGSFVVEIIAAEYVTIALVIMSVMMGYSVSTIQFHNKGGSIKTFHLIGVLISVLAFVMMYIWYYTNIII